MYDVHDTHAFRYLDGSAPDITITRRGHDPTSFSAIMLIELQVRLGTMLGAEPLPGIATHDCMCGCQEGGYAFLPQFASYLPTLLPTHTHTNAHTHAARRA